MDEKEQAVIDYLQTCNVIRENPMFFNFINAKDKNKQFLTTANDKITQKPFIDGSVEKRYTFTIIDFQSVTYNALVVGQPEIKNENVQDFLKTKEIINWVKEQSKNKNYPDFGTDCIIEDIRALTDNPNLNGVDTSVKPALAKYSISIQIDYLDVSEVIWD